MAIIYETKDGSKFTNEAEAQKHANEYEDYLNRNFGGSSSTKMVSHEGYGVNLYSNGDKFWGEYVKGFPQGKGKMLFNNGDIYEKEQTWKKIL
jgi:hypothetical protein